MMESVDDEQREHLVQERASETFGEPPRYPIESVGKALRLLSLFLTDDRIRVKDAAEMLGVATGTAHRLLAMLQYHGYVAQDPLTKVYVPGSLLVSIGLQAAQRLDIRSAARPHLEHLRDELDETIQLATLQGTEVLFVDAVESTKTLKVTSRAGTFRPAHCTSVGKALLAELTREQIVGMYPEESLPKCSSASVSSVSQLLLDLDGVRTRGYALNFGELEDGIGSVAAVVRDASGRAVAAIGAGGPLSRLDDVRMRAMADAVRRTADEVGAAVRVN